MGGMDWINVAQDREWWLDALMNFRILECGEILD